MKLNRSLLSFACVGALSLTASNALALNNYNCRPAAGKLPVVIAHGQGGNVESMTSIVGALEGAGYCVFGEIYGVMASGGLPGRAHLDQAGAEYGAVVDKVIAATRSPQVHAIGYSEGGMVVDNFVLKKGGAGKINRFVGFAPGHHPYAHFGIPKIIDGVLYAPNVLQMVRDAVPPFTSNITITEVVSLGLGIAGGAIGPNEQELAKSEFVADLFDANYWISLHGSLPEPEGTLANLGTGKTIHTYPTKDTAPTVCYTNMISPADMLVGASAGFTDAAPNVANVVLNSFADHVTIIDDKAAIGTMLAALNTPCVQSSNGGPANGGNGGVNQLNGSTDPENNGGADPAKDYPSTSDDEDDLEGTDAAIPSSGCGCKSAPVSSGSSTYAGLLGLGVVGLAISRRRRSDR